MHAHTALVRETAREHKEHDEQQHDVDERDDVDLRLFVATGFQIHGRLELIGPGSWVLRHGAAQAPAAVAAAEPGERPSRAWEASTASAIRIAFFSISTTIR